MKATTADGQQPSAEKARSLRKLAQIRRLGAHDWFALGLLAWAAALAPGTISGAQKKNPPPPPILTVRVYNYAKVSVGKLRDAQREAARIIGGAGVETIWLDCMESGAASLRNKGNDQNECSGNPAFGAIAVLRILNRSEYISPTLEYEIFGYSQRPLLATVLYDRVSAFAKADGDNNEAAPILGDIMAHEIGHLLLGPGHSPTGIMRGQWDRGQLRRGFMGRLMFTPDQCSRIHAAIEARMKPPGASQASPPR